MDEEKTEILREIKNSLDNCNDVNKIEVINNIIQYKALKDGDVIIFL